MSLLDGETDVEDPRSFAMLSPPNQLVASPRWAQQYEVVVATSAIICKKGFAPHTGAVLFRHNLPQPTQAQLMRGEFPETLCIEQGVVLSCRFAESKVLWASRVLWMAVVSQSSVK